MVAGEEKRSEVKKPPARQREGFPRESSYSDWKKKRLPQLLIELTSHYNFVVPSNQFVSPPENMMVPLGFKVERPSYDYPNPNYRLIYYFFDPESEKFIAHILTGEAMNRFLFNIEERLVQRTNSYGEFLGYAVEDPHPLIEAYNYSLPYMSLSQKEDGLTIQENELPDSIRGSYQDYLYAMKEYQRQQYTGERID